MAAVPDPWSTPTQPLASPLFNAGPAAPASPLTFNDFLNRVKGKGKELLGRATQGAQSAAGAVQGAVPASGMRAATGLGATALGIAPGAISTFQQQGPVAGIASTAAGLGTAAVVNPVSNLLMRGNLPMKLAGGALQLLAPAAAQAGTASLFGATEKAKTGAGGADVSIPATPISSEVPLSDAARERIQRERDLQYEVASRQQIGQTQLGLDRQAMMDQVNSYVQLQKALQPLAERTMRQQLVNQQALINTQSAAYQTLGRQAGMFKLAGTGMQEAGATLRTAISSNPYANAVLQAPSISFG